MRCGRLRVHDDGGDRPQDRVSEPTFYRWKKVYTGMGVTEIRRRKQLDRLDLEPSAELPSLHDDLMCTENLNTNILVMLSAQNGA